MRHIGEFSHPPDMRFTCGAQVVVSTDRGIELGQQVSLTCYGCEKSVTRDQMRAYAEASGGDHYRLKSGRILREATEQDLHEWKHIQDACFDKLQTCRTMSRETGLEMKIVDCEHLFGGERIIFYFMSEQRVDFRQLVHRLATEFQTRIEMRQVGARDEARLVADFETCGRECCCKNFLKTLKPVSMSMAKLQKTTLDLSKVSGRCGRLKCCLRYEHETYEVLDKKLPRSGRIRTAHGVGQIVDRQVLTQLVKIRTDDGKLISVVAEDILETGLPPLPPQPRGDEAEDTNGRSRGRRPPRAGNGRPAQQKPEQRPRRQPDLPSTAPAEGGSEPPPASASSPQDTSPEGPGTRPEGHEKGPRRSRRGRRRRRPRGPGGGPAGAPGGTPPGGEG